MPFASLIIGKSVLILGSVLGIGISGFACMHSFEEKGRLKERQHYIEQTDKENERLNKRLTATHKKLQSDYANVTAEYQASLDRETQLKAQLDAFTDENKGEGVCSPECLNPPWLRKELEQ